MAIHKKFDILNQAQPIEQYDWVFIDSQARPDRELMVALASGADLILIPSETSATPLRVTAATAFDLPPDCKNYRVFFNKVPSKPTPRGRAAMAREALIALGIPVLKSSIAVRPAIPAIA